MLRLPATILLLLVFSFVEAQFAFTLDQSIPVEANGKSLAMPWAGGLNASQFNTIDLNGDGKQDLVTFDRTANKILTYLNQNNQYIYAPAYESLFPEGINQWLLLRDFNCDGKKDIFTSDPFGITAYVNVTKPGQRLAWRPFRSGLPILTIGISGNPTNIKINASDIPAIDDIDGDGDLDILSVYFVGGPLEFNRNTGSCDSMRFEKVKDGSGSALAWGNFKECECSKFAFGGKECPPGGGRTQHTGGKAILTLDINGDGAKDLFFTEESCTNLFLLPNQGTKDQALMNSSSIFSSTNLVVMPYYPSAFSEDVDFDGLPDIVVSPNISFRSTSEGDFKNSVYLFKNSGSAKNPQFTFIKRNFLQSDMIDVGDNSIPAFFDSDGDGDLDMFISNYTRPFLSAQINFFENVGTSTSPSYKLVTEDYFSLSTLNYFNVKIQFADVNGDSKVDLAFTATTNRNSPTSALFYLTNDSYNKFVVTDPAVKSTDFVIGLSENLLLVDVNQDGLLDILVGTSTGALEYWKNQRAVNSPSYQLVKSDFLGLGNSPDRQNLSMASADLDADGKADLIVGDQRGALSIYGDFRSQNQAIDPAKEIIFNDVTAANESKNLGGNVWPTVANLFNSDRPHIVVGNTLGGLFVLKNNDGNELPAEPSITLYPNPVYPDKDQLINIRSDRDVLVQFYNLLGLKMSESYFIPGHRAYQINVTNLPKAMYIARFSWKGKPYAKRFVVQ